MIYRAFIIFFLSLGYTFWTWWMITTNMILSYFICHFIWILLVNLINWLIFENIGLWSIITTIWLSKINPNTITFPNIIFWNTTSHSTYKKGSSYTPKHNKKELSYTPKNIKKRIILHTQKNKKTFPQIIYGTNLHD